MISKTFKQVLAISLIAIAILLILNILARTRGVGYTGEYKILDVSGVGGGRGAAGPALRYELRIQIYYNPVIFLLSHIFGSGNFTGNVIVLCYPSENVYEVASMIKVGPEVIKNLPYLLLVSLILGVIIERLLLGVLKPQLEKRFGSEQ